MEDMKNKIGNDSIRCFAILGGFFCVPVLMFSWREPSKLEKKGLQEGEKEGNYESISPKYEGNEKSAKSYLTMD